MLPLYLLIGGFNVCCRSINLVLVAWAVHDIRGNQHVRRIGSTHILDRGGKRLWMTSCGTHISFHFICQFLPHVNSSCVHIVFFFLSHLFAAIGLRSGSCFTGQLPGIGTVFILASLQMRKVQGKVH